MDERFRFVARLLEGEKMTAPCAEPGISRMTGSKNHDRYKAANMHSFGEVPLGESSPKAGFQVLLEAYGLALGSEFARHPRATMVG
jgi:hypothetical protein